ncbi:tRNA-dihydrouridine(20) synthase [NAD(P)+]-like [Actinomortierella wolfii]|nr:tRNA-dihydrouridine(20) synthase [NAD(P)+]-like [Actinomortierella wolfii]
MNTNHLKPIQQAGAMKNYNYKNKVILAPMVRVGTLPTLLLSLEFGADLVYTPKVADPGISGAEHVVSEDNGTIDYLINGNVVFRTHPSEKDRLVFQIGSANPDTALQAALTVIFPDVEKTLALVKQIVATGIKALAVHCWYQDERPGDPGHWDRFQAIVSAVDIPVIANGDEMTYDDIAPVSGAAGVMIARGAELNVSLFRPEGTLPLIDVVRMYVRKCMQTRNIVNNTKYALMQMFKNDTKSHYYQPLTRAKTFRAICQVFEMEHELDEWQANQAAKGFPTEIESLRPNHQHTSVPTIATTVKENGKALTATELQEMEQMVMTTTLKRKARDDKEEKASFIDAISPPNELSCEHHPNKNFKQRDDRYHAGYG